MHQRIVALVTGASKGIGKAIAIELGKVGAKVYCASRTSKFTDSKSVLNVEATALEVNKAGGLGIPYQIDFRNQEEIKMLFQNIEKADGYLNLLVNNVWGGYENEFYLKFAEPFHHQDENQWERMIDSGLKAHYHCLYYGVRLMIKANKKLIINTHYISRQENYLGNALYDFAKNSGNQFVKSFHHDLEKLNIPIVGVMPGFTRTESVLEAFKKDSSIDLSTSHSANAVGMGIVLLYNDEALQKKSGKSFYVSELSTLYGFKDLDGKAIPVFDL